MATKFRGQLKLGKFSLSTFPVVKITVDGFKAMAPKPFDTETLAQAKKIEIKIPLYSLLWAPRLTILLSEAEIRLVDSQGKTNLTEFLAIPDSTSVAASDKNEAAVSGDPLQSMPSFLRSRVENAKMTLVLDKAFLSLYKLGASKKEHTTVKDLNFTLNDLGFNSPIKINVDTSVDYKSAGLSALGPLMARGQVNIKPDNGQYFVNFNLENDLSALELKMAGLFSKDAKTPMLISLDGTLKKYEDIDAEIKTFAFRFGDLEVKSKMDVKRALSETEASLNFNVESNKLQLSSLEKFIPMVAQYHLKGQFSLKGNAVGPLKTPNLNMEMTLNNVTGKTPELSTPLRDLDAQILITGTAANPILNLDPIKMKVGTSDLAIKAIIAGIEAPNLKLEITSNRFNVDELMGTQSAAQAAQSSGTAGSESAEVVNTAPLDETLDKMAPDLEKSLENPMLNKIRADVKILARSMRMLEGEFKNARLNLNYASRVLSINNTGIDGYKGSFVLNGALGLNPKLPSFDFSSKLQGVSIGEALKVHMPAWKNELSGNINGQFSIKGKGLRKAQLSQNLSGGLSGEVKNGRTSIPVVKLVSGILEKLPKKVQNPAADKTKGQSFNGEFKTMQLQTTIKGRDIRIDKTDIVFATEKAGLGEMKFLGSGNVNFDRQMDFIGTAFLSPQVVPLKELKGPSGQIEIPLRFKGLMNDPSPDIGYSVGILGPRMLKNFAHSEEGQKVVKKAGEELQKQIEKQKLPEPAKKALEDIRKKFKF